jgi:DNA-binding transcriptional ArsR family regulator
MSVNATFTALADDTRRGSIEALASGPKSAGELAAKLGVTPAALTGHLRVLRNAGLVRVRLDDRDSRRHLYSLEPAPLHEVGRWVESATSFWSQQLASFALAIDGEER